MNPVSPVCQFRGRTAQSLVGPYTCKNKFQIIYATLSLKYLQVLIKRLQKKYFLSQGMNPEVMHILIKIKKTFRIKHKTTKKVHHVSRIDYVYLQTQRGQ